MVPFDKESKLIHCTAETAGDRAYVSSKGPGMGDSHWDPSRVGPMVSDRATQFIREQAGGDRPFFLCYWTPMVYVPHLPPEEFDGLKIRGATLTHHLHMVLDLDQQVGRLISSLKEAGVWDNPLFIFSSDNGGLSEGRAQRALLRCRAGEHRPGSESGQPVAVHDVVATMAAAVDQRIGENEARDSLNLLPHLLGNFLRRQALPASIKHWSLTTPREKLIKTGARMVRHARYVTFQMAEVAVPHELYREILRRIAAFAAKPVRGGPT